jgi:hypothetical protein
VAADPLDIVDLPGALRALNLPSGHTPVEEIEQMVTDVSRDIDRLCGPVVRRNVTERLSARPGSGTLQLTEWPVSSVTTLTEYSPANATGQVLTAEDEDTFAAYGYLLDPDTGTVTRRSNGSTAPFVTGDRNLVVVYVAGRYATTAAVDGLWRGKAKQALRRKAREEFPTWARTPTFAEGADDDYPGLAYNDAFLQSLLSGLLRGGTLVAG